MEQAAALKEVAHRKVLDKNAQNIIAQKIINPEFFKQSLDFFKQNKEPEIIYQKKLSPGEMSYIQECRLSHDNRQLIIQDHGGNGMLLNLITKKISYLNVYGGYYATPLPVVAFKGNDIIAARTIKPIKKKDPDMLEVVNLSTGGVLEHTIPVQSLTTNALSADGTLLVLHKETDDNSANPYYIPSQTIKVVCFPLRFSEQHAFISPNNKIIVTTGCYADEACIWRLAYNIRYILTTSTSFKHYHLVKPAYNHNSTQLALKSSDGINVWDLENYKIINTLPVKHNPDDMLFSKCGSFLTITNDNVIEIWNLKTNQIEHTLSTKKNNIQTVTTKRSERILRGESDYITCLVYSSDEKLLIAGGDAGTVYKWNMKNSPERLWLKNNLSILQVAFINQIIAANNEGEAYRIELGSDDMLLFMSFPPHNSNDPDVRSYLLRYLNIKLPSREEVIEYRHNKLT
jgi:WD40 repeat protein